MRRDLLNHVLSRNNYPNHLEEARDHTGVPNVVYRNSRFAQQSYVFLTFVALWGGISGGDAAKLERNIGIKIGLGR